MVVGDAGGSAKATWWVEEALDNARTWFPEMSEPELRGPLEQAFELAGKAGRGEREFHEVFEAELRRAVEERDVVGSGDSVLPGRSAGPAKAFPAFAAEVTETGDRGPAADDCDAEADEPGEEPSQADDPAAAADAPGKASRDEGPAQAVEQPRRADRGRAARTPREQPSRDHDHARAFVVKVGALRFHEGLSPDEIQDELGVDAGYYAEAMRWLLHQVDRTLEGDYPAHLDRRRMAALAAGLEKNEDTFAVERHVRECPGCATYLADLLEASLRAVERGVPNAGGDGRAEALAETRASAPPVVTYTRENAWTRRREPRRRPRRSTPAISLRAAELRRYSRSPEVPSATAPAEPEEPGPAAIPVQPVRLGTVGRRDRRVRALVPVAVAAAAAAVVALVIAALPGDTDKQGPREARADSRARSTSGALERQAAAQKAAREREAKAARERAERKERRARAGRRAARRRLAARRARRRQSQRRAAAAAAAPAPSVAAPAPAPPPAEPVPAPAPTPPPAPSTGGQSVQPSGPSGEFGLEP